MTQTRGFNKARRRYTILALPAIATYIAILVGVKAFIDEETAPAWLNAACALAAALPIFVILNAIRRLTDETDEYMRLKYLNALRDGGLITAGLTFFVGFLQIFDVIGTVGIFWSGPLFFFAFSLSYFTNSFGRTV